uniref:Urocanate hydratase n=1 Tax=Ditylenchus dipsaci TaxID=166011 RepID=A0A915CLC1_9BILA
MNEQQTLVMYSGHPLGLFPSHTNAPRMVITNGMMIPNYSTKPLYDKYFALGVTLYGQMTAGSYCYIGPQGIVHGTTITLRNAGRKYLNCEDLSGKIVKNHVSTPFDIRDGNGTRTHHTSIAF